MILKTTSKVKKKIAVVCVVVTILIVVLAGRVAWIQLVRGNEYTKLAYEQQNSGRTIPAVRGTITDANGNVMAISVTARQISVNQTMIKTQGQKLKDVEGYQKKIADKLAEFLETESQPILDKIKSTGRYKEIARKIDVELADKIQDWIDTEKIKGVYIDEDVKRYYPNNELACHVLGFTGRDDQGLVCGVEVALDNYLQGTPGRIISAVDSLGNELPYAEETRVEPQNGNNVRLTIDATIQSIAESVLETTTAKWNVSEGCAAIVMDPKTANILAFASNPGFDLNHPYACPATVDPSTWTGTSADDVEMLSSTVWRNKCLTDTYEPGSTFKAITAAIGIENGAVTPETTVDDSNLHMSGWEISCWKHGGHGTEPFKAAVENSCNAVFAKLALKLGNETFYNGLKTFGFYDKTGIMLSGTLEGLSGDDRKVTGRIATGKLAAPFIARYIKEIQKKYPNVQISVTTIENRFFGEKITVSGLITGQDLKEQLSGLDLGEKLLIPCSMLKGDEEIFLDDMTLEELSEALNTEIVIVDTGGRDLVEAVIYPPEHKQTRRRQIYEQTSSSNSGKA